jgi:predicted transcriptional regulator
MSQSAPNPPADDAETAAYRKAVEDGIKSLDAGRGISYERVRDWLLSWGTKNETPPPTALPFKS